MSSLLMLHWFISLFGSLFSLRPTTESKPNGSTLVSAGVVINQSPQLVIADVIDVSSLISPYFFV